MNAESRIAAAALKRAVEWVKKQVRKDRENRYSLLHDWRLPACRCSFWPDDIGHWETDLLRIERNAPGIVSITVKAYQSTAEENICDGATLSPDDIPGILPAALFHDPWYCRDARDGMQTFEALAFMLGVSSRTTRKFGDALFYSIARAGGCNRFVAACYYAGIRIGYPLVKPFLSALAAFLLALAVGGCAGCVGPGDDGTFLDPSEFQFPTWEKVQ